MPEKKKPQRAPVFEMYSLEELAMVSPYTVKYLRDIKNRRKRPIPKHFRRTLVQLLRRSDEVLFGANCDDPQ